MRRNEGEDFLASMTGLVGLSLTLQALNKSLEVSCGLSIVQWSVLRALLDMPAVSPLVLAKALKITPGTLTQSLSRLSSKDLLFMCSDPGDARKKMISITRKGRDLLQRAEQEYSRVFKGIDRVSEGIAEIDSFLKNTTGARALQGSIIDRS